MTWDEFTESEIEELKVFLGNAYREERTSALDTLMTLLALKLTGAISPETMRELAEDLVKDADVRNAALMETLDISRNLETMRKIITAGKDLKRIIKSQEKYLLH